MKQSSDKTMSSKVKEKPSQINMQPEDANQNQDPKDKSPNLSSKKKTNTQKLKSSQIPPDIFEDQTQNRRNPEKQSSSLNSGVKLENSQSSMRSSVASLSLNASSMLSGKSLLLSKRSSGKKQVLKQVIGFGSDEIIHANPKNINKVRLTRYTLLSFVPLSLLYQFKRAANIYFLLITVFTFMPFTPKDPSSMIGTFLFVLILTMLKEAFEDFQRYKMQNDLNGKKAKILMNETGKFEFMKWEHIKAGMIIRMEKDNEVPADVLLIHSSNISGLIFVDTMALDGETNLKEKSAICEAFDEKQVGSIQGEMTVDTPNELLDYWEGFVQSPQIPQKAPSTIKNLVLRGSFVRNTKYAYGIVIYTGMQTKILKNLKKPPHKVSNVMKKMNQMLYTVFAFQIVLVILFAGLNYNWAQENYGRHEETGQDAGQATFVNTFLIQVLVFWVAYSHLIPISLYVIIEMLKLGQGYLINKDLQLYDKETKSFANCRNSDLIEELGQVEMIFSDKTGTLTMNKMVFKKCQINGDRIADNTPALNNPQTDRTETNCDDNVDGMNISGIKYVKQKLKEEGRRRIKKIRSRSGNDSIYNYPYTNFVMLLSLCHTVVCDTDLETKEVRYQASSPDELALVQGARDFGVELVNRSHNKLELNNKVMDSKENYRIVAEFPFDSTRKCMSVIVRDQFLKYYLLTKGADSVLMEKISFEKSKDPNLKQNVLEDLSQYSREGYRTLVMAMRQVPEEEYINYNKIYTKLVNSNSPYKDKKITELYVKMEKKLRYLGCTAIEDKLQDGVPQTIAMLIKADIRFWMLTGDKLETAIEIAKSCRIILDGNQLLVLSTNDFEILNRTLDNQLEIQGLDIDKKVKSLKNYSQQNMVIAIDGSTLNLVLEDPELEQKFFYVSLVAKSVICCRVSPKQKADIVSLYKKRGTWVTMSVGDGANDVSMILEADIGIGIKGKEGTQAVRNADYAISQFRFIQKLLLVHGHWGYRRVAKMICYYFYKNVVLVFTEIYFATHNGFSGQIFFADWLPMLYNAIFTSWPCLLAFNFEQDVNPHYAYKYPITYKAGQEGKYFNFGIFWRQILLAAWHGVAVFHMTMMSAEMNPIDSSGMTKEHWYYSTIAFTLIIHIVSYKLFLESNFWNIFSFIACLFCVILYYFVCLAFSADQISAVFQFQLNGVMTSVLIGIRYWMMFLLMPFICLLPDFLIKHGRAIFYPYPAEMIMIEQKKNPHYSFMETTIKSQVNEFLANAMRKNKSYGQLTSKALSEIEKQSNVSGVLSQSSSMKRFSPNLRDKHDQIGEASPSFFKKDKHKSKNKLNKSDISAENFSIKEAGTPNDNAKLQDSKAKKERRKSKRVAADIEMLNRSIEKEISKENKNRNIQRNANQEQDNVEVEAQEFQLDNDKSKKRRQSKATASQEKQNRKELVQAKVSQEIYEDESDGEDEANQSQNLNQSDILNASTAQLVGIKSLKEEKVKNNKRMSRMAEKDRERRKRAAEKNQGRGNESNHNLLINQSRNQSEAEQEDEEAIEEGVTVSTTGLKSNLQNQLAEKQRQKEKERQREKEKKRREQEEQEDNEEEQDEEEYDEEDEEEDYYGEENQEEYDEEDDEAEGDTQDEEEEAQNTRDQKSQGKQANAETRRGMSQMREQSYKERKRRLMDNIKKEQQKQREDDAKLMKASYHSTKSNNKFALSKIDEYNLKAENKRNKKGDKNTKKAVKDHLYGHVAANSKIVQENARVNLNTASSNSGKRVANLRTTEIPHMISFQGFSQISDTTTNLGSNYLLGTLGQASHFSNFILPPEKLKQEGHPLEKGHFGTTLSSFGKHKTKKQPKRYVQRYRDLINITGQGVNQSSQSRAREGGDSSEQDAIQFQNQQSGIDLSQLNQRNYVANPYYNREGGQDQSLNGREMRNINQNQSYYHNPHQNTEHGRSITPLVDNFRPPNSSRTPIPQNRSPLPEQIPASNPNQRIYTQK